MTTPESPTPHPLRVAVIGSGPAGIYAAAALVRDATDAGIHVAIDIIERMPAPFGLIRYGVAPDHPRIKGIITALHKVLDKPEIRLIGNVEFGADVDLQTLQSSYDAVIFATGADSDRALDLPGIELKGSYGAADFVSWYDGHPDVPRTWPLDARSIAVLGVGNVALDVARMLAKTGDEQLVTEIPDNVYAGLQSNQAVDIHVFGRRGPAQAKFTPLELKELDHSPTVDVVVSPDDIAYDAASDEARANSKMLNQVVQIIEDYSRREPTGARRRLFLHFFESPVEVVGENGQVVALRTERTELDGTGNVRGTGVIQEWPVQAIYRAVGYLSQPLADIPFDARSGTIPNSAGRIHGKPGMYCTGWIKRGPVGLIGHTKSDANETIACLLKDLQSGVLSTQPERPDFLPMLEARGISYTTWDGWYRLDAAERARGKEAGRTRIKIVERRDMVAASEPHSA